MEAPTMEDPATGLPLTSEDGGVVDLLDGTRITYRPIRPEDAPALQRFHSRLSYAPLSSLVRPGRRSETPYFPPPH